MLCYAILYHTIIYYTISIVPGAPDRPPGNIFYTILYYTILHYIYIYICIK